MLIFTFVIKKCGIYENAKGKEVRVEDSRGVYRLPCRSLFRHSPDIVDAVAVTIIWLS